ncbi:glycosyl hydrolase [Haloferula sp. A504]|uniref:glycosyl hydrolase n=1 Tax=Haloferula sp. A504 TaxID=3373601 RepID=UPI0031C5EE5C|nr:hypothetical protein [Verrucomicrobiaceae bacterium E54]
MNMPLPALALALLSSLVAHADDLADGFRTPPHSAGIRAFWWWLNGNVTEEAISRDLEAMKAKGFSGALIFDADGSSQRGNARVPAGPVFGSPEWTALFIHACQEAKRLGLELSLNIQSGWNLGGPRVSAAESSQHLVWSSTEVLGPGPIDVQLPKPKHRDFYRDITVLALPLGSPEGTPVKIHPVENLPLKSSTRELGMSAPDCRFLLETKAAEPGEWHIPKDRIVQLGDRMDAGGRLQWQVPTAERWVILRIGHEPTGAHVSTHSEGWGGRVLDYLSPAALDAYWKRNIDPLFKAIGPLAGTTMRYVHTDSWEGGGMNWTPGFDTAFAGKRGYDPLPWLAVVAGYIVEDRETSNAFLADFRKTIGDLVAGHYARLATLSAGYGMGTHPECSGPHAGPLDGLKNYGRSELMMSEFWSPSPHRPKPDNRFYVKQASSAAHTYGKPLVGAEGFTTIGPHWNDTPWSDMKPSFDTEFCAGLNLVFNHTFTCSPEEMGLPGQEYFAGTHFNPQVTWWEESTPFIDYLRRCQYLGQQGRFVADVLHYYGDHIPNVFGRKGHDPAGALPGYDYDVLSEELLLSSLAVENGRLVLPSGMSYRLLSLPDHRVLSPGALEKVDALVRAGATVLGPKPSRMVSLEGGENERRYFQRLADGLWGAGDPGPKGMREVDGGRVGWGVTAAAQLQADGVPPDAELTLADGSPAPDTDWIHYRIDGADVYFIAELAGRPRKIEARFRVTGRTPELWDATDGSVREASSFTIDDHQTTLPIDLGAYDSLFLVFRDPATARQRDADPNRPVWSEAYRFSGPWKVTFDPARGGPAEAVDFARLTDWIEDDDPAIRNYSGKATYRTSFEAPAEVADLPLAIELGEVRSVGIARVTLNGTDLGLAWRPPFRLELGDALKPGKNRLEVMVVNSWHNRVMADEALPQDKRFTRTNIRVEKKGRFAWKPEPSGLIGPVRVVVRE